LLIPSQEHQRELADIQVVDKIVVDMSAVGNWDPDKSVEVEGRVVEFGKHLFDGQFVSVAVVREEE
jgi:hypothetical protein